jgi:diaminohydroxyphosphoribosylaminopyrimidine deaminase/5-amino-6-(5-phosphoribosylamino)uracil reductase
MRQALQQARKGLGRTSPNPAVGAVIVKDDQVLATGYHRRAGLPHAEVEALNRLGGRAPGATLYVTLEPCNHQGRTPPCTQAILQSGIRKVVVGTEDPNPDVSGGGCRALQKNGVQVETGILEAECRRLNEAYFTFVRRKRPFVTVKSALTLDGWAATATGDARWITNDRSRRFVHRLRDQVDGILVGVGTVLADNPQLTARIPRGSSKDPVRIIADTHLRTPGQANVLHHRSKADTVIVVGPHVAAEKLERFRYPGVRTLVCPVKEGKIDLVALLDILGRQSVTSLLVEGGAEIVGALLRDRLVDKFLVFKAPKILGGDDGIPLVAGPGPRTMDQCIELHDVETRRFGTDVLITGYPGWE